MTLYAKLRTFLLLLALTGASAAFAQFTGAGRVGVNFSNLRGSSVTGNSMLIGYNIGGFVNYSMKEWVSGKMEDIFSIQTGLSVQQKGATLDYSTLSNGGEETKISAEQVFTYAEIPLLAKFTFTPGRSFSYFGEAGFFLGALTGLTVNGKKSWDDDLNKSTDPRKYREEYSGFDLGLSIGAGVSMTVGGRRSPWSVFGNVRGSMGVMNIGEAKEKTPEVLIPYLKDVKTGTVSLLAGVAYAF